MNLLIAEPCISISPTLAARIGVEEAAFVQQVHFFCTLPNSGKVYDGFKWVYNTYDEWVEKIPFLKNKPKVQRIVSKLEKLGLLVTTDKYNNLKISNRKWYRVNYESELLILDTQAGLQSENEPENQDGQDSKMNHGDSKMNHGDSNLKQQYTENTNRDFQQRSSFVADAVSDGLQDSVAEVADGGGIVGVPPTPAPRSGLREDKKRFEALARVFNRVFENCPAVAKVSLATVPDPKTGRPQYTQTNLKRLKLVPYAWSLARQRVQGWADENGLIDGEEPSAKHVLQWFEAYFAQCRADGFVNGSQPRSESHANWRAGFDFLLRPVEMEKRVFEGGR